MFSIGDNVKVKCSVLEGAIIGGTMDAELNAIYLVEYVDGDAITQQRYFKLDEIEAA
jgi:hypothetical protein